MLNEHGSSSVTVNRARLLEALKQNRARHKSTYEEALSGYMEELRERLRDALEQVVKGIDARDTIAKMETPASHLKQYDRAISMLEMSTSAEIELSEGAFRELVLDEWKWKERFLSVSASYTKSGK